MQQSRFELSDTTEERASIFFKPDRAISHISRITYEEVGGNRCVYIDSSAHSRPKCAY